MLICRQAILLVCSWMLDAVLLHDAGLLIHPASFLFICLLMPSFNHQRVKERKKREKDIEFKKGNAVGKKKEEKKGRPNEAKK